MIIAQLLLYLSVGLANTSGIEYSTKGSKILVDTLWASNNFGVPVEILLGQTYQESSHQYWQTSPPRDDGSWDTGFNQMNMKYIVDFVSDYEKTTGLHLTHEEIYFVNIKLGAFILGKHYHEFKDWSKSLQAYNGGPFLVRKGIPNTNMISYSKVVRYYSKGTIFFEEVLPSFLCAIFQHENGKPIGIDEMKVLLSKFNVGIINKQPPIKAAGGLR